MIIKFINLVFLLILSLCVFSQDTAKQKFLSVGIYLENLRVTIPWDADYRKMISVGNPIADTSSKREVIFKWDSVRIFDDIDINLRLPISRRTTKKDKPLPNVVLYGITQMKNVERINQYLSTYTEANMRLGSFNIDRKGNGEGVIGNCLISTGSIVHHHKKTNGYLIILTGLPQQDDGIIVKN